MINVTTPGIRSLGASGALHTAELITGKSAIASSPSLVFDLLTFQQLDHLYRSFSSEFQLMGLVELNDTTFHVTELVFNRHRAGKAHAHMDVSAYTELVRELEAAGKDIAKLRFQAHSHGKIDSYFSDEDVSTIRDAYVCDWMISLVGNQLGNYRARLDIFDPVPVSISLPIAVLPPSVPDEQSAAWLKELNDKRTTGIFGGVL